MALIPLEIKSKVQKAGLIIYSIGMITYFISWLGLMKYPDSVWSKSVWGFLAPAYTPAIWLTGIGLITARFYFNLPYRRWYFFAAAFIFLVFHLSRTLVLFQGQS